MEQADAKPPWFRRRNWWKIGFFVMLIVFEFTREIAVLASNPQPKIATMAYVGSIGGFTTAKGRWIRLDGGEAMVPTSVSIECSEQSGECLEITTHMLNGYMGEPNLDRFEANFESDAVSYENDLPNCARYSVRIDLKLEKVIAVRQRKPNPSNATCRMLEQRIEMTLGDGYQEDKEPLEGHFVPLLASIAATIKMFG